MLFRSSCIKMNLTNIMDLVMYRPLLLATIPKKIARVQDNTMRSDGTMLFGARTNRLLLIRIHRTN